MDEIKQAWRGEEKLWKVFWIYNFLFGAFINWCLDNVEKANFEPLTWLLLIITPVWIVWVAVSMWRCAFNSDWRPWGYIVRGLLVLCVVAVGLAILGFGELE